MEPDNHQQLNTVILEDLPVVTKEVLYAYFKKYDLKDIQFNKINRIATIVFANEAGAKQAMLEKNGKAFFKIPVNMSFKIHNLTPKDLTQFRLTGLDQVSDLNKIYRIGSEYGRSCKLKFRCDGSKVFSHGFMSITYFIGGDIEVEILKSRLKQEGVACEVYVEKADTGKGQVNISEFADQIPVSDLNNKTEQFTKVFKKLLKDLCNLDETQYNLSIIARSKSQGKISLLASIYFQSQQLSISFYQKIQDIKEDVFKRKPKIAIRITNTLDENNNKLVTLGLKKPEDQSQSDFERELFDILKETFKGILVVELRALKKSGSWRTSYMAYIELKSLKDRNDLMENYLDEDNLIKLQRFYLGAPNFEVFRKKARKSNINNLPSHIRERPIKPLPPMMEPNLPLFQRKGGINMPYPPMGMPLLPGWMPMPGGFPRGMPGGIAPFGGMPMGPMGNPMGLQNQKHKFLKEKDTFINKDPTVVKKVAAGFLIAELQQANIPNARTIAAQIIASENIETLFKLIEDNEELKKKAAQITSQDFK